MKTFLMLYIGGSMPEGQEAVQAMMSAWRAWYEQSASAITDTGSPLCASNSVGSEAATTTGVSGYTVIQAESLEAATALCSEHPHLAYGGTIDIHEAMNMSMTG